MKEQQDYRRKYLRLRTLFVVVILIVAFIYLYNNAGDFIEGFKQGVSK